MLTLEIFESREALTEYLYKSMSKSNTVINASPDEVLDRIGDKGQEWYCISYCGNCENISNYLSAIKVDNWKDYYLHINMPQSYSLNDMTDVASEVCKANNSPQIEPVVRCTCDSNLPEDTVEITIVVPKFDLNWHFGKMWNK